MLNKRVVGQFGIKGDDGRQHVINWVVTPRRGVDNRRGYVNKKGHYSEWHKKQFVDMFRGWK